MAFIDKTTEIAADVHDVYELWTAFEDYPKFMDTIETVTLVQDEQLHWVALIEDDTFEWNADLVEHTPDEKVTWKAVDGRETGEVRFEKLGGGKTQVTYQLKYDPAAWGCDADKVRRWMSRRVDEDLDSFKEMVEAVA
jgi:uncharacterized membrane protein